MYSSKLKDLHSLLFLLLLVLPITTTWAFSSSLAPPTINSVTDVKRINRNHKGYLTIMEMIGGTFELPERPEDDEEDDGDNNHDEDEDDDYEETSAAAAVDPEVEAMRQRLMASLGQQQEDDNNPTTTTYDELSDSSSDFDNDWQSELESLPPTPLTAIGRERMIKEITLLEDLAQSDDSVADLWDLWFHSRGPAAAQELSAIEGLVLTGEVDEAATKLRSIIDREGLDYVEPIHRLANLLMDQVDATNADSQQSQQLLEESKQLYQLVLSIKPWHFGALTGMVQVCRALGDEIGLQEHSRNILPSLHNNDAAESSGSGSRQEWVQRMVSSARNILQQREQYNNDAFNECDMLVGCALDYDEYDDAWQ